MTDKQLAILLSKYEDKINSIAEEIEKALEEVTLADITSPQTAKNKIFTLISEFSDDIRYDITLLEKK